MFSYLRYFLVIVGFVFSTMAFSHAPSKINLEISKENSQELNISVLHGTLFRSMHRVSKVVVKINGEVKIEKEIEEQTDRSHQELKIMHEDIVPGAVIEVIVECNLWGSLTEKIEIPQE